MTKATDTQVGGTHYSDFPIQPGVFVRTNGLGWYEGNAIKYICRHKLKGGKEDLLKAKHYLDLAIEEYEHERRDDNQTDSVEYGIGDDATPQFRTTRYGTVDVRLGDGLVPYTYSPQR